MLQTILIYIVLPFFAYLLGSIPWGLVLTRAFTSVDIRKEGSGNIGATNVRRIAGTTLGVLTLSGDVLKGAVPVYLASCMTTPDSFWGEAYLALIVLSSFSGHLFPLYLNFKDGGKGVATAAGCFLVLSPVAFLVAILVFVLLICWSGRVSAASMAASLSLPVAVYESTGSAILTVCAVVVALFICERHKENIKRLLTGTEPSIFN